MADLTRNLGRAAAAGFIATYIATRWGYLGATVGLRRLDLISFVGAQVSQRDSSPDFIYNWGAILHYVDGMILAVIFSLYFYSRLPGPVLFRGLIYSILVWIGAGLVYLPLAGGGLFGATFGGPFVWAVLISHIVWGIALGAFYSHPRAA